MILKIEHYEAPTHEYYRISDGAYVDEYCPTIEDVITLVEQHNLKLYTYMMEDSQIEMFKERGIDIDRF